MHIVTVNDYLAKRDSEWMGKVYRFLGLSVGLITVSYTHLDVYKRQPQQLQRVRVRQRVDAGEVHVRIIDGLQPVSYTHLDVYKRQIDDGQSFRVRDEGNAGSNGGPNGDLLVTEIGRAHV